MTKEQKSMRKNLMKKLINYVVGCVAISIALLFLCSNGWWIFCAAAWSGLLYMSGIAFPEFWEMFWETNKEIVDEFEGKCEEIKKNNS